MSMVQDIFPNHLLEAIHKNNRVVLENTFPDLKNCNNKSYLSLSKYINLIPERFYSQDIFEKYYSFLKNEYGSNKPRIKKLLNQLTYQIDRAYLNLDELNRFDWHDTFEKIDDYETMRFIDQTLNPTYLKLIEGVYFPFIYLLAFISREGRGKNTDGLDLFNCFEELKNSNKNEYCELYDHTIRNGIAHGGVTYKHKEIKFHDKRGNSTNLMASQFIDLIDNSIDICNGIVLASKIFFLTHLKDNFKIPHQLMIEELQAETAAPWWKIEGSLNSEINNNQSQLIIYVRPNTRDSLKTQYFTFMTGALSELFAPGYDRYFISLCSNKSLPGWAVFDGKGLERVRKKDSITVEDYKGVLIDNLIFYIPKIKLPRFLGKIDSLVNSFSIQLPIMIDTFNKQLNRLSFSVRMVSIHRNGWRLVLNGSIILYEKTEDIPDNLKRSAKRIIKKALKKAKKEEKNLLLKFLPLGYSRLTIFCKDHRKRKLSNYGLGSDLIGTIQIQRIKRIKAPDILNSTIEKIGSVRFAWNKAWIESC